MGYLGRRIGLSQDKGDSTPDGADGAVGGGILDLFAQGYFTRQDKISNIPSAEGTTLQASGGLINDYTSGSDVYRAHIFTSSGTFEVTSLSGDPNLPNGIEYLVVGGGGGGGGLDAQSGGGGAGGFRTNLTGHPVKAADYTISTGTYTVTVGGGGASTATPGAIASQGGNSEFFPAPVSYPSTERIRAVGGGGGVGYPGDVIPKAGQDGGSGGGAACSPTAYSGGTGNTPDPNHPQVQGYDGGDGTSAYGAPYSGGGGGGAGRAGGPDSPGVHPLPANPLGRSTGGYGLQCLIAGPPASPQPIGAPGPGSGAAATGYFAGGGGGGSYSPAPAPTAGAAGGYGGGGDGAPLGVGGSAVGESGVATSGGGGGGGGFPAYKVGGNGGSGVVVVRYKIGSVATAKATGGVISFYGGKTIHVFTGSGTFATTSDWSSATVEYVVIGGGGAGGGNTQGGGGGAGAYRTGTTPIGAHPVSTSIQVGAGGQSNPTPAEAVISGTPSYFGTPIAAAGGGAGGVYPGGPAMPGGSGGGGWGAGPGGAPNNGGTGSGDPFPGAIGSTPSNGWGHDGGQGGPYTGPAYGPAGGGGAGSDGSDGSPSDTTAGRGGAGIQIPATFRDPSQALGASGPTSAPTPNGFDTSGKFWFAGGGGGTGYNPPGTAVGVDGAPGGAAPGTNSPYAGGGGGAGDSNGLGNSIGAPGVINTGGGGGGGERTTSLSGGRGGSGIVLIAYPT